MENDGKRWKMVENDGKRWKMVENDGKMMENGDLTSSFQHSYGLYGPGSFMIPRHRVF